MPAVPSQPVIPCAMCRLHWRNQLHGFSFMLQRKSIAQRVVWFVVICLLFVMAVIFSVVLLKEYVDRRVVTLNTIHQVQRLHFPNISFCPKHVDTVNFTVIENDLRFHLPHLSDYRVNQLLMFAMAGAGFQHFDSYTKLVKRSEVEELADLFRHWRGDRSNLEFFKFFFEENGYKCEQLFQTCYYGKREIPCCDLFRPNYVMMRGRCFIMREFAQTEPDEAGKLMFFFHQMHSPFLDAEGTQKQIVAYISQLYEDIPTFPRFYLNNHTWYRIRLKKRRISMLSPNPHCASEQTEKRGNCYVESWHRERVTKPFNCTIFYLAHKNPELEVCDPKVIFLNYRSVLNMVSNRSAYQNLTKCLPACQRDIIDTQLYSNKFQDQRSNTGARNANFHLEASYDNLQVEYYEEQLTTTTTGFISQIGGQLSFFLGISSISVLQFFVVPVGNALRQAFRRLRS
uniref:Acid-sensing ion channel 1-like n=1 Tax=Globodera pallida TaxID=36090 RepID=A0A183C2J1_GLOPA